MRERERERGDGRFMVDWTICAAAAVVAVAPVS